MVILIPDCLKIFINNYCLLNKAQIKPKFLSLDTLRSIRADNLRVLSVAGMVSACCCVCLLRGTQEIFAKG